MEKQKALNIVSNLAKVKKLSRGSTATWQVKLIDLNGSIKFATVDFYMGAKSFAKQWKQARLEELLAK